MVSTTAAAVIWGVIAFRQVNKVIRIVYNPLQAQILPKVKRGGVRSIHEGNFTQTLIDDYGDQAEITVYMKTNSTHSERRQVDRINGDGGVYASTCVSDSFNPGYFQARSYEDIFAAYLAQIGCQTFSIDEKAYQLDIRTSSREHLVEMLVSSFTGVETNPLRSGTACGWGGDYYPDRCTAYYD